MADAVAAPEQQDASTQPGPKAPALRVISDAELAANVAKWLDDNMFEPAKAWRSSVVKDDRWPEMRDMYAGDYNVSLEDPDADPFNANIVLAVIDTVKGTALQSPAVIEFTPQSPDDEMFCAELTAVISEYVWGRTKARFKLGVGFTEGGIIGTAWSKTFWNPALMGGEGDLDFMVLPAEEIWVDPACTGINDWNYICHAPRRPVIEVKYADQLYNETRINVRSDEAVNAGHDADTAKSELELVTVKEHWIKGPYLKAMVAQNPGLEPYVDDDGYKYGMQVICANGELVLKIESHPSKSDRLPFQRFVYYAPQGNQRVYGMGEVKNLTDTQEALDARVSMMLQQAALIANQQWVVSEAAQVDDDELTNVSGQIVHVLGPPDSIKRIEPTGISGALFQFVTLLLELKQIVSGVYDVNAGANPGSIRAGVAIQALQRGGDGRTGQKTANFDDWVADIGLGLADVMAANMSKERVYRIVGSAAQDLQMFSEIKAVTTPSSPADKQGFLSRLAQSVGNAVGRSAGRSADPAIQEQQTPEEQATEAAVGQIRSTQVKMSADRFKKDGDKRVILDCRAQVGMMLRNQNEQLQRDVELLKEGVVDAQYVIENNNLRGRERLLMRLMQVQTQQQAAQQPAEQGPAPEAQTETGNDSAVSDADAEQVSMIIEDVIAQIDQAEASGQLPQGTSAQAQQMIAAEIQQGGTGEMALQQVIDMVNQIVAQQAQGGGPVAEAGAPV